MFKSTLHTLKNTFTSLILKFRIRLVKGEFANLDIDMMYGYITYKEYKQDHDYLSNKLDSLENQLNQL